MTALSILSEFDRTRWARLADCLAVGVAISLPWSTSATGIFIALWLIAIIPTLDVAMLQREVATPAGGLPVLLWGLAAVGMLWADVSWTERFAGLGGFNKLLVIPLLLAQFRRSDHGMWVLYGFFASVLTVLLVSWTLILIPELPWHGKAFGIPAKDYIAQGETFLICAFALIGLVCEIGPLRHWRLALGLLALVLLFLINILVAIIGRTVLLIAPVLFLLLGWRQFGWKGLVGAGLLGAVVGAAVWCVSSDLRQRVDGTIADVQAYRLHGAGYSTGLHLEFLKKSLSFVATAPILGHGTGSIPEQFRKSVIGETGAASAATVNPHNQIFAVSIQVGLVGAAILIAMWVAHFMLFRGAGLVAWIGAIIVTQNVVASLVNTHLFDFGQGWLYVFGVGVAGGTVLRQQRVAKP